MSKNFPTLEKLESMSVEEIKALYPVEPADEALMQQVLDKKRVNIPIVDLLDRSDVPDIRTPQDEAKWQKILDERQNKIDVQFKGEAYLENKLEKLEEKKRELEPEVPFIEAVEQSITQLENSKIKKVFCEECGSKSPAFHRKGCSKIIAKINENSSDSKA